MTGSAEPPYDVAIAFCSTAFSRKLVEWFDDEDTRCFIAPTPGFGTSVKDMDPPNCVYLKKKGPQGTSKRNSICTALVENVTVPWADYLAFIRSSIFERHIRRMFRFTRPKQMFSSQQDLVQWLKSPSTIPEGARVRVAAMPKGLQDWITDELDEDGRVMLDPAGYTHVVQAMRWSPVAGDKDEFVGMVTGADDFYRQPDDWEEHLAGKVSRAGGKMWEALQVAEEIERRRRSKEGTGTSDAPMKFDVAIDVGASPGAWTQQLAERSSLVLAVDPAELHPDVLALPNVKHAQVLGENLVEAAAEVLEGRRVEALVSDINKHPCQMADVLQPLLAKAAPGCLLVLTLKFRGTKIGKGIGDELVSRLGPVDYVKLVWLFSNTQPERTLIARVARG